MDVNDPNSNSSMIRSAKVQLTFMYYKTETDILKQWLLGCRIYLCVCIRYATTKDTYVSSDSSLINEN